MLLLQCLLSTHFEVAATISQLCQHATREIQALDADPSVHLQEASDAVILLGAVTHVFLLAAS